MGKIHQELYVHYQYDYDLYGLQTDVPEYKLAWQINRRLSIALKKNRDITLEGADVPPLLVSNFIFTTPHRTFRLLKNQAFATTEARAFLLPELEQWDYFLQVQDPGRGGQQDVLLLALNALSDMKKVACIALPSVAHKENLLF